MAAPLTAGCPRHREPGRSHRVHRAARTPHSANSKEPGAGEGAPRQGAEWGGGRGAGRGENGKCYNFLPCPPPRSAGWGRAGRAARSANEFTFFFSPRPPPPLPPPLQPPPGCRGRAGVWGSGLGSGGLETAREAGGEGEQASGRGAPRDGAGPAGGGCPSPPSRAARTRVRE